MLFGYPQTLASEGFQENLRGCGYQIQCEFAQLQWSILYVVNNTYDWEAYDWEEDILDGDPQVVDLNFKCEEGPLTGNRVS